MVRARHPQGHLPRHPVVPGDGVFHAVGQGVPQVELTSHVRWGDDHHEESLWRNILDTIPSIFWLEEATLLPPRVPSSLYILRTVGIRTRTGRVLLGSSWSGLCVPGNLVKLPSSLSLSSQLCQTLLQLHL